MLKRFASLVCCCVLCAGAFTGLEAQTLIQRNNGLSRMIDGVCADSLKSYVETLAGFKSRHSHSSLNAADGELGAAQQWLKKKFELLNPQVKVNLDSYQLPPTKRVPTEQTYRNVVAVLPGSNPADTRVYMMSGHLDSRAANGNDPHVYSPGANDDASSIAAMLEICRVLKGKSFPATLVFVAFSGEEVGLRGADAMAQQITEQGWNLGALFNNDMIGQSTSNGTLLRDNTKVRIFSRGVPAQETEQQRQLRVLNGLENDGVQRQLARYLEQVGERYVDNLDVVLIFRNDRFGRGGDHTPFVERGYPAVRITEINENFNRQHKDIVPGKTDELGDVPAAMDFEYLRKTCAMNLACLVSLASAPSAPLDPRVGMNNADNHTHLSWNAPVYGNPAGYYVVMRETTDAQWEKQFFTTETTMVLPYSRDNYVFGVQSVGVDGFESVVVPVLAGR